AHHLSYAAEQNLTVGVFGDHTARAKLERADDIRLLDALSDEDGADLRFDRGECAQHVSTMRARHRYIEQQDVWPQLLRQPECLGTAPRFSDHEKVGFPLEKAAEAFAMDAVVVSDQDTDPLRWRRHEWSMVGSMINRTSSPMTN